MQDHQAPEAVHQEVPQVLAAVAHQHQAVALPQALVEAALPQVAVHRVQVAVVQTAHQEALPAEARAVQLQEDQ